MDRLSAMIAEQAGYLARRLAGRTPVAARRPVVGDSAREPRDAPEPTPADPALHQLAQAVIQAALSLEEAADDISLAELEAEMGRVTRRLLDQRPDLPRPVAARLAAEVPALVRLPALARLARQGLGVDPAVVAGQDADGIVTNGSPAFARVLEDLRRVAATELSVLLEGESGTGKELLARRLHRLSPRREGPLVALNCAALPQDLLESELFGHVKGAFTGAAASREGYLGRAHGGTLFLDEIGEASPELQVTLLRVLEDRLVTPVGGRQGRPVDFRLVCASSRDLRKEAEQGRFSQALLYRIRVVPLRLPPLRRRPEDLPALIDYFLERAGRETGSQRRLSRRARRALLAYRWPGNIRQLQHVIQRLVVLSEGPVIEVSDLPAQIAAPKAGAYQRRLEDLPDIPRARVADLARLLAQAQGGEVVNRDVRRHLGCSDSTARKMLRGLTRAGVLKVVGDHRARRYLVDDIEEK